MAHRIQVISIYRPRIDQGNTVQKPELIRSVSRATGIVEALLDYVIKELRDKIIEFLLSGRSRSKGWAPGRPTSGWRVP